LLWLVINNIPDVINVYRDHYKQTLLISQSTKLGLENWGSMKNGNIGGTTECGLKFLW
jgi:hypothetical protein